MSWRETARNIKFLKVGTHLILIRSVLVFIQIFEHGVTMIHLVEKKCKGKVISGKP